MVGDRDSATGTAEAFVHAVIWGEHTAIWDLLGPAGRVTALNVAQHNGMDRVVASRITDGLADPREFDDFLRQLVGGIRRDLRSVDLNDLRVHMVVEDPSGQAAVAHLVVPSSIPGSDDWAAGSLELRRTDPGRWSIDRLNPMVAGP